MAYTSRVNKGKALSIVEMDNNFMCHYPIGSLYINALSNESPHNLIGYGSWEQFAQGYVLVSSDIAKGPDESGFNDTPDKFLLAPSLKVGDSPDYYSPGFTGGAASVNLNNTIFGSSLPAHTHYYQGVVGGDGDPTSIHPGRYRMRAHYAGFVQNTQGRVPGGTNTVAYIAGNEDQPFDNAGGNQQHNNIQPYITVNIWKRIK